jgi:hypothetical protein
MPVILQLRKVKNREYLNVVLKVNDTAQFW